MDNYRNEWLDNNEASLLNRETEILQQLQSLQKEYNDIQTQKATIKTVREGKEPISTLIGNDTGQGVYSGLVKNVEYPVKMEGKGERGTAKRSGDNNLYYKDSNGNIVQASSIAPYNPAGGRGREVFDNIEIFATDVKRGANALVKGNAYSNLSGLWNWDKRGFGNNLLNNRSINNSSMKRLGGPLF